MPLFGEDYKDDPKIDIFNVLLSKLIYQAGCDFLQKIILLGEADSPDAKMAQEILVFFSGYPASYSNDILGRFTPEGIVHFKRHLATRWAAELPLLIFHYTVRRAHIPLLMDAEACFHLATLHFDVLMVKLYKDHGFSHQRKRSIFRRQSQQESLLSRARGNLLTPGADDVKRLSDDTQLLYFPPQVTQLMLLRLLERFEGMENFRTQFFDDAIHYVAQAVVSLLQQMEKRVSEDASKKEIDPKEKKRLDEILEDKRPGNFFFKQNMNQLLQLLGQLKNWQVSISGGNQKAVGFSESEVGTLDMLKTRIDGLIKLSDETYLDQLEGVIENVAKPFGIVVKSADSVQRRRSELVVSTKKRDDVARRFSTTDPNVALTPLPRLPERMSASMFASRGGNISHHRGKSMPPPVTQQQLSDMRERNRLLVEGDEEMKSTGKGMG